MKAFGRSRGGPKPQRDWWVRVAGWLVLAAAASFIVFCLAWRVDGGRWVHVETSSMGEVAPVGSLLWVKPVHFDSLNPGDFITFHPPGRDDLTYSHLVHARNADGTISTKGVIPSVDPWKLTANDVVGKVRMNWWGAGWLIVAGPFLLVGFAVTVVIRSLVRPRWKLPVALVLTACVLSASFVIYKPFINAVQLSFAPSADGGADAAYVGTGLLPIRLTAHGGESVVMHDGQIGRVHVSEVNRGGRLEVDLKPALRWWWWLAIVLVCFLPALYLRVVGVPALPESPDDDDADKEVERSDA
jgi:hypothetical protein